GIVGLVGSAEGIVSGRGIVDAFRVGIELGLRGAAKTIQERSADDVLRRVHLRGCGDASRTVVGPNGLPAIGEILLQEAPEWIGRPTGAHVTVGRRLVVLVFSGSRGFARTVPRHGFSHSQRFTDRGWERAVARAIRIGGGRAVYVGCDVN